MRVTGGIHRSRILRAPRGSSTRPTSDRVREALFSILGARRGFKGLRVLDLYAGSGALAIEALSRGAAQATLVEQSRDAIACMRQNLATLGLEPAAHIIGSSVERALRAPLPGAPFDILFADPPYDDVQTEASPLLSRLVRSGGMATEAELVLEHRASEDSPILEGLELRETRRYGDTALAFFRRARGDEVEPLSEVSYRDENGYTPGD